MIDGPDSAEQADEHLDSGSSMPFLTHLEELRWRLLKSILSIVVLAAAAFYFRNVLFDFLILPLGDTELHFTEVTGSFYAYMKVALITGLLAALPFVFYQFWSFIAPGLYQTEKAAVLPLVLVSTILFLIGATFCYLTVLPTALWFLIHFSEVLVPVITVNSYISFSGMLLVAFGCGFELPVVSYFLGRLGIINARLMSKVRRYAFVAILIVGAIITPPDVLTQVLLAGPVYLLYEISIIIVRMTERKREKDQATEEDETPSE
ncbi:MAG: twin-arginine translocase subunit TatC [candidate division Zixibacteria bacterium]|nr:twin-arginine translocase subunit TatC [candidate division Zixibacteria bacterium]MDH3938356.1 twin-arginine translocase subunit TatC [candidate division Zixibacteria bacterium]MDH4032713.1 twin-arginine translocase subunit TatC [candidate division Zixibacteria bacterium]